MTLPNLLVLTVPGDLVEEFFFGALAVHHMNQLRTLELDLPYREPMLGFSLNSLIQALPTGFPRLRSVGISTAFVSTLPEEEELDFALQERASETGSEPTDGGVYYM